MENEKSANVVLLYSSLSARQPRVSNENPVYSLHSEVKHQPTYQLPDLGDLRPMILNPRYCEHWVGWKGDTRSSEAITDSHPSNH